ncbi:LTA synthase family protein [Paenibacillus albicereus]|uniref:LTA synthase family protein n=1 Tax=Paenibacillus albicereus TaxID=2726185 RepID=A0A6H2GTV0_9BACL|nr:LTA synthase family protein [Paenibacillus albicereus]QJC50596.1 LTA synthase family protein [Paenibacillus albicereus]
MFEEQPSRAKRFWLSPFVLFTVALVFKLYLAAYVIYGLEHPWLPLVTGLPTVWAAFFLIELLARKRKLMAYLIVNLAFTAIYFAVIMYYKYFGIIVTYHALSQAGQVTEVKGSVFQLLHPYFMLIFVDIVLAWLLLGFSKRLRRGWQRAANRRFLGWRIALPGFVLAAAACFALIWPNRGIANELVQTERMGIVNYELFLIASGGNESFVPVSTVTQAEIDRLKGLPQPAAEPASFGAAKGRDVIVVQLEALQNFVIGKSVDGKEITPNLNALIRESVYFPRFYQQAGSGNTSDAEFLTNTSLYVPLRVPATEAYSGRSLPSLPKLLKREGYETMTFHTNDVAFWNRSELYRALGFDRYYDTEFFGDEDIVAFGASDEVLYRKTVQELARVKKETGKPSYSMLISMSSHHPYNIPARKVKLDLPAQYDDSFVGDYLRAQNYTDYALGQLFQELKDAGLWDNSLIVLYGDHMGLPIYSLKDEDLRLLEQLDGRKYDSSQMLNIPLIVSAPGALEPAVETGIGGQSDIMPTIANLAGLSLGGQLHFGQDLLNERANLLPERYYLPSGSFINDREIFIPGTGFGDGRRIELPAADAAARWLAGGEAEGSSRARGGSASGAESGEPAAGTGSGGAGAATSDGPGEPSSSSSPAPAPSAAPGGPGEPSGAAGGEGGLGGSADDRSDGGPASATQEQFDRALKLLRMSDSYVRSLPSTEGDPAPVNGARASANE